MHPENEILAAIARLKHTRDTALARLKHPGDTALAGLKQARDTMTYTKQVALWEHQKRAMHQGLEQPNYALFLDLGCISGEAIVKVSRGKGSRSYALKDLYRKFNAVELMANEKGFDRSIPTYARSLKDDFIGLNQIIGVKRSGVKVTYELKLCDGKSIRATLDHKILTQDGWKELQAITTDDSIAIDTLKKHATKKVKTKAEKPLYHIATVGEVQYSKVKLIKKFGEEMTYDISCLTPHHNFVANDIVVHNCGKTATAINVLAGRCDQHKRLLRTLILGPVAVVENWRREIAQFSNIPKEQVITLLGSAKQRTAILTKLMQSSPPAVLIMNYEGLIMADIHKLLVHFMPEFMILDESHRCKSITARRTKIATSLADLCKYRLILTGTPILNSPMDVFSQYRILDSGQTFGKNFYTFRQQYFYDKNAGMPSHKYFPAWCPRPGAFEEMQRKIYLKAIRVMKSECLDLPPLVRKRVYCDMAPGQKKNYQQMLNGFIAYLDDKACVAELALTKGLRLQQILTGFFVDTETDEITVYDKNPRLDALQDVLENIPAGEKVIVWACFRENYKAISALLEEMGLKYVQIVGGMTNSARQDAIDNFQSDPDTRVMLANQAAGGTGINLTAASYAVYYSRNFRLEDDLQSEARNYRGGSQRHESITRIDIVTPGTIDEVILDALASKESIANIILTLKDKLK